MNISSDEVKSLREETGVSIMECKRALEEAGGETDFVARSDAFKTLAHDIAMHIVATRPDTLDELLSAPFIKDDSMSVKDLIERTISVTGENITLADYAYMSL